MLDREDTQGIALHGYRRQRFACAHLLCFEGGQPRHLLSRLLDQVSSAAEPGARTRHNVAFTASGLSALGLSAGALAQFSREFRQGMGHPERAVALRDQGSDSAVHWDFGGSHQPRIDALWLTFAESAAELDEVCAERERLFARFEVGGQRERVDELAQEASSGPARERRRRGRLGELLLGEHDSIGERHAGPFVPVKYGLRPLPEWSRWQKALNFGLNGSYLVLRKLVHGATDATETTDALRSHGATLQRATEVLGAERAPRHRVWSRSRNHPDGLLFMALNADIRRQFEFLAQNGLRADESRHLLSVRGGAYFFLPSLRALNYLAEPGG